MSSDVLLRLFGQTEVLIIAGTLINRDDILIFVLNKLDLLRSEKKIFFSLLIISLLAFSG